MRINKKLLIIIISIISLLAILTATIIIKNKYTKNKYVDIIGFSVRKLRYLE